MCSLFDIHVIWLKNEWFGFDAKRSVDPLSLPENKDFHSLVSSPPHSPYLSLPLPFPQNKLFKGRPIPIATKIQSFWGLMSFFQHTMVQDIQSHYVITQREYSLFYYSISVSGFTYVPIKKEVVCCFTGLENEPTAFPPLELRGACY